MSFGCENFSERQDHHVMSLHSQRLRTSEGYLDGTGRSHYDV